MATSRERVQRIFPILGLSFQGVDSLTIGDVDFRLVNSHRLEGLVVEMRSAIYATADSEPTKSRIAATLEADFRREFPIGGAYAVVVTDARTDEEPFITALHCARGALDLLRFALPLWYDLWPRASVVVKGDAGPTIWRSIQMSESTGTYSFGWKAASFPVTISEEAHVLMEANGLFALGKHIPPAPATKFERAIFSGIRWFSRAQQEEDLSHELASLVIALETIVHAPGQEYRLSAWLSEGIPLILETDLEKRRDLNAQIRKWYEQRSGTVHGNSTLTRELDSFGGIQALRDTTHKLLLWAIANRSTFKTTQNLQSWLLERRLSA